MKWGDSFLTTLQINTLKDTQEQDTMAETNSLIRQNACVNRALCRLLV